MINSMTAFAHCEQTMALGQMTWEIRSVNHRYLDFSFRLPEQFRRIEPELRDTARQTLQRGKIECHLHFVPSKDYGVELSINTKLVDQLIQCGEQISQALNDTKHLSVADILRWPEVTQQQTPNLDPIREFAIQTFGQTIIDLQQARQREGHNLAQFIQQRLDTINSHLETLKPKLPEILQAQRNKLLERFSELQLELEPNRLEQEMVILTQKQDVSEELDRLHSHLNETRYILNKGGTIGRRLDFLMQELNRETNTLASKSADRVATRTAVELKVLIEQMREQIQNIE